MVLSEVTLRHLAETQNPLVGACSHRLVSARCWPVKPKSPLKGFFSAVLRTKAAHLNRWPGRKDTKHFTRVLVPACQRGTGVVSEPSGETNSEMNESLPSGHLEIPRLGILGRAYHPWGSYV
jgi:hypothetical protein